MKESSLPLVLKFPDWPADDQRLWQRCRSQVKLFDTNVGAFAGWSEGTCSLRAQGYGAWLSYIARCHPEMLDLSPTMRIKPKIVSAFVDEGLGRLMLRSIADQLLSLATVIRGFAPDLDIVWLWRASDNLRNQAGPQPLKPPLPVSADQLFQWSLKRLDDLSTSARSDPRWIAMEFRQALMVGVLISCPVRARAFMAMTVESHIDISDGHMMLSFAPQDMKDRKARRMPVPAPLIPFVLDYLKIYRPLLLDGRVSDALWISQRGNPLCQDSFTSGLAQLTKRHFGVTLRPHAFRHIAATSIATADPTHAGIIRDVLGHTTLRTAQAHYNRATAREVSQRYQDILRKRKILHRKRGPARKADRG